jgi:uncharacterized protein (TIGR02145 family)
MKRITSILLFMVSFQLTYSQSNSNQEIILQNNWGIFSTYLNPIQPDVAVVTAPILTNLFIVKNWQGHAYWPQYNVNLIGNLIPGQGYQIKMLAADTLLIEGTLIQPELLQINLPSGWNILGYVRTTPAPIIDMLSPINDNISIVKNWLGQPYWPQYGINLIGGMQPGQGYQIKMQVQDTLVYPPNEVIAPFACGDQISDYDGNTYNTVLIGTQCWMKENMKSTHYADGTALVDGTSSGDITGDYTTKYHFDYYNDTANTSIFGKFYTWAAVMNGTASSNTVPSGVQGICPTGWHVPGDEEWKILEGTADSQYDYPDLEWDDTGDRGYDAGINLKNAIGWNYNGNSNNGVDSYGFSALPGGPRLPDGYFGDMGYYGYWWSSSEYSSTIAWYRGLTYYSAFISRDINHKSVGLSVRCLWDSVTAILPTLTTNTIANITQTTATCGGAITNNGGATITARGFCWNTTGSPTLADSITSNGTGTGTFINNLSALTPNTTYHVKAYASNSVGTAYGNEVQFTTNPVTTLACGYQITDYDGNTYNTVLIGSQCWMKENLKTTHYADGTPLVDGTNTGNISGDYTTKYYFDYNNDTANTAIYGKYYTWAAIMNNTASSNTVPSGVQGICPMGFHLPSDEEWKILEGEVDSLYGYPNTEWNNSGYRGYDAGLNLKTTTGWNSNGNGTDLYSFSALPGGYRGLNGAFYGMGDGSNWWSTSEYSTTFAWGRVISYDDGKVFRNGLNEILALNVRCLKD